MAVQGGTVPGQSLQEVDVLIHRLLDGSVFKLLFIRFTCGRAIEGSDAPGQGQARKTWQEGTSSANRRT